jgi:hypothetical protein
MLVQSVLKVAENPEMIKILSQNLGHQGVLVTLSSYGSVDRQRQAERIAALDLTVADQSEADALAKLRGVLADPMVAKVMRILSEK